MRALKKFFGWSFVILLVALSAAIIIPNYLRSKIPGGSPPGRRTLLIICSANETYSATYGNGFARSLSQLEVFGTGATKNCDHAGLIFDTADQGRKEGFTYTYRATPSPNPPAKGCTGGGATGFSVNADPAKDSGRKKHYFIDETGVLRSEMGKVASSASPID